METVIIFKLAR